MNAFEPCASCARHIKRSECVCPFCGTPHRPGPAEARPRAPRVSRAAWLVTTLTLVGCSSASTSGSTSEKDASPADQADSASQLDGGGHGQADAADTEEASVEQDAAAEDAGHEAGWHTCYGAPPMRRERVGARHAA